MTRVNTSMRAALLTAMLWAANGAFVATADPLDDAPQTLPDPSPQQSPNFPPALATSGTADPGQALAAIRTNFRDSSCTALNPCAAPPPPLGGFMAAPSRTASNRD